MTVESRNAVRRYLFSGVVIDEPKKRGPYMDWDRINVEQTPL